MAWRSWWWSVLPLLCLCVFALTGGPLSAAIIRPDGDLSGTDWDKVPSNSSNWYGLINEAVTQPTAGDTSNRIESKSEVSPAYFSYDNFTLPSGQTVRKIRVWCYHYSNEFDFHYSVNGTSWYEGHWIPPSGVGVYSWRYVDIDCTAQGEIGHALSQSEINSLCGKLFADLQDERVRVATHYVELDLPPTASITAPAQGACVKGDNVTVTAQASDDQAAGDAGVTQIDIYWSPNQSTLNLIGTCTYAGGASQTCTKSWNTTSVSDGTCYLRAKATDQAGNVGWSDWRTVTVDNSAPSCELTAPTEGQWLKKGHLSTSDETTLAATASDAQSGIVHVSFYIRRDGEQTWYLKGQDSTAPYQVTWDTDGSPVGLYYAKAVAQNGSGLEAEDIHSMSLFWINLETTGLSWDTLPVDVVTVSDANEDWPGAYLHYNVDNDNENSDANGNPIADYTETDEVSGENDPRHMTMTIDPLPTSGSIILSRNNANAKVWSAQGKGNQRGVLVGSGTRTWNLANSADRTNYQLCADALWAEGVHDGTCDLTVTLKDPSGTTVGDDSLKHTYVAALCGRQPRSVAPPRNERVFYSGRHPNLVHCEWSITGEESSSYNCIAWSVDQTNWWYNDIVVDGLVCDHARNFCVIDYDPQFRDNTDGILTLAEVDRFYSVKKGYTGYDSGPANSQVMYYSGFHAARRRTCDCGATKWIMYESKDGRFARFEHVYNQLDGGIYGARVRYYR